MTIALTHVSLLVRDVPNALKFYHNTFGLEIVNDLGNYAELKANENLKLSLFDRKAMAEAVPTVSASAANGHRSVLEFKVEKLEAFCATLRSKGIQFVSELKDQPDWGIRTAYIEDLDGNLINLFEPLQ